MKLLVFLVMMGAPFSAWSFGEFESRPVESLDSVDVGRYLGRWYQIARNPLPFEPLDCACAQQTLGLQDDGVVSVYNSCNVGGVSGQLIEISGTATSQNEANSQFSVDFGFPDKGKYWIIAVEENYAWAVVTDPERRSLYILSKTPELSLQMYTSALAQASKQISIENLLVTNHSSCTYPE